MQDSNMRKRLLRAVLFVAILYILIVLLSYLFSFLGKNMTGKVQDRNTNITGIQVEEENSIEVLVLGDSESYTSISPMQLFDETGITSYICGQSGQRMVETCHALEIALKNQKPKVVLLETNTLYRMKGIKTERDKIIYENLQFKYPLFRYHNLWKRAFRLSNDTRNDYKGFVIRDWTQPYCGGQYMHETDKVKDVHEFMDDYMEKLVKLCKENDIELVLYSAPAPKNYNMEKHNGLVKFAKKYDVTYLDLNLCVDELGIDWSMDTADKGDHLNLNGATKVTSYMGAFLKENYELSDYTNTELGEKWKKLVDIYKYDISNTQEVLL